VAIKIKQVQTKAAWFLVILLLTASCSNNKHSVGDLHIHTAEMHERTAKNYRERGIDHMADYYNDEAQKERYKAVNSCDLLDVTLSIITLGFFDCE